jgi:diguanylate cyclase (GGDEF)-like protein
MSPVAQTNTANRSQRIEQFFWVIELCLGLIFLLYVVTGSYYIAASIAGLMVILSSAYFQIKSQRLDLAAGILIASMSFFTTLYMWLYGGLTDEVLIAYPSLLVFSALLGNRTIFLSLLVFLLINVVAIGGVNTMGWRDNIPSSGDLESAVLISIILLFSAFSIWLLASDLQKTLVRLEQENARVVQSELKIQRLAHYDRLTELPNLVLTEERFEQACLLASKNVGTVCLLNIDLDKFESINDSFGYGAGDLYIQRIANRLKGAVGKTDIVGRQGGDRFLVVLGSVTSDAQISSVAEHILQAIKRPVKIKGVLVTRTASIGVATLPIDGNQFDTILKKADRAMYHAKEMGRNSIQFYNDKMEQNSEHHIRTLSEMHDAIKNNEFVLHYQPKIELKTGRVVGAEALIRWQHPERGMIPPNDFIPLAESSGFISELGDWVMQEACNTCKTWLDMDLDLSVAVNVSAVQLRRGNIADLISKVLSDVDLPADRLELELTESTLIDESNQQQSMLSELRAMGIDLSIDDFGTGYSNLGYLKNLEIGILKIDRSFVSKMLQDGQDKAIIQAVTHIAASLQLKIVAEGIEDKETADALTAMNCDYGQGFYWSPALPSGEFVEFVRANALLQSSSAA